MESRPAANQQNRARPAPDDWFARGLHYFADGSSGPIEHLVHRDRLLLSQLHHRAPRRLTML